MRNQATEALTSGDAKKTIGYFDQRFTQIVTEQRERADLVDEATKTIRTHIHQNNETIGLLKTEIRNIKTEFWQQQQDIDDKVASVHARVAERERGEGDEDEGEEEEFCECNEEDEEEPGDPPICEPCGKDEIRKDSRPGVGLKLTPGILPLLLSKLQTSHRIRQSSRYFPCRKELQSTFVAHLRMDKYRDWRGQCREKVAAAWRRRTHHKSQEI